jgi:ribonucleoside-diphosphate reductase alpha chain
VKVLFIPHVAAQTHRLVVTMDDAEAAMLRGVVVALCTQLAAPPPAAGAPVPVPAPSPPPARPPRPNLTRDAARTLGFEGDPCPECGQFMLVRNGTCLKCDGCGATTGCS